MIQIKIEDVAVETKQGIAQKTGKPYSIREQTAWGFFHDVSGKLQPHPQRIRLTLDDQAAPYPVGTYTLAPESFYPDRYGQVACRVKLRPVAAAAAPKAA